ncbi:HCCA isomerase/glutathione S-transferase kappa [Aulographum hederae CBS 113979]|uniref:Glutathione S-transferase kappa n=1 Tax=Aulographum hederae CBS 113979 TaxID=1176131 RepID=A0A6G1GNS3_9PEZI|nr:HCCA isomerase/glutathione S-transferase kappa [Aulographum hederae CBS 113979]
MAKPKITLFVDTVSPFAYMAFYALQNFPIFKQVEITYIPIFLGGLMKACGNNAPINIKNKDKWIDIERKRWARLFEIPMKEGMPSGFPPMTLPTQRALCALSLHNPGKLAAAMEALFSALWVEHKPVQSAETLSSVLAGVLGKNEAKTVMEKSTSPEAKSLLTKNTDLAFSEGGFGLPWFVATNSSGATEGFWGFDHLGQLADFLQLERPKTGGWRAML